MCQDLRLPNGDMAYSVGEAKSRLKTLVYNGSYLPSAHLIEDSDCLCCLDFERTAEANGLGCQVNDDYLGYIFTNPGQASG